MSKVKRITVSNLKAVSAMSADFNGCTALVTGGNNKGKSSFLKSLPERLRGNKPDMVLKHGEKDGFAEWELTTGEKFVWTFNGKKEKLTFITERNIPQSVTKDLCKAYFPPVFDVDTFLNDTPAKQKKTLQQLTGIDFSEIDVLYKAAYEERTWANKRLAEEKVKFDDMPMIDHTLPKEPYPVEDIEKELSEVEVHNLKYQNQKDGIAHRQEQITRNEEEINELIARIAALENENLEIKKGIAGVQAWLAKAENQPKGEEHKMALKEKIRVMKEKNILIAENQKAVAQEQAYKKAQENAKLADDEVKRIEAEKLEVIRNASMPEGFGFDDEGITYNGHAFNKESLSSSAIYIAALKLAAIGLGEVKTLHFDASFLDKKSLQEIEAWANENDLQLLIERPDFEGGEIEYQLISE